MEGSGYEPEELVLSSLLRNQGLRSRYLDLTQESDFSNNYHRQIFSTLVSLVENSSPITVETVTDSLNAGGDSIVRMMATFLFSNDLPLLDEQLFKEFKEQGVRVRLTMMLGYLQDAFKKQKPTVQMLAEVQGMLQRVEGGTILGISDAEQSVMSSLAEIDSWSEGGDAIRTGIPEVDRRLFLGRLLGYIILAAPPSTGKTALLLQWLWENLIHGIPCALFSLEMSKEQIVRRLVLCDERLQGKGLTEETLYDPEYLSLYKQCLLELRELPLYIIDDVFNVDGVYRVSRSLATKRGVKVVAVDYLQLLNTDNPRDNEVTVVSKASQMMKRLTKADLTTNAPPVVAIGASQYSREETKRRDDVGNGSGRKKTVIVPRNSGLKGSSQLEQDADLILHLMDEFSREVSDDDNWVEPPVVPTRLYCGKNREWERGWAVRLTFDKTRQRFLSLETEWKEKSAHAVAMPDF